MKSIVVVVFITGVLYGLLCWMDVHKEKWRNTAFSAFFWYDEHERQAVLAANRERMQRVLSVKGFVLSLIVSMAFFGVAHMLGWV